MRNRRHPNAPVMRTLAASAAVLGLAVTFSTQVRAQDAERPLGILLPGIQQPAPDIRSPIPQAPQSTTTGTTAPSSAVQGTPGERPLGRLFNTGQAAGGKSGSLLPQNWNTAPSGRAPATGGTTGTAAGTQDRPLGTLFNAPAPSRTGTGTTAQRTQTPARAVSGAPHPAQRVYAPPSADATNAKPLGTLFGDQQQRLVQDRAVGTSSSETRSPLPRRAAAPASTQTGTQAGNQTGTQPGAGAPPQRAELSADSMTYDRDLGMVVARGNVEIVYGPRTLLADKVAYNQKTDVVTASGDVSMTDETGKVLFGDKMEITGDLKDGVIYNIGLVLEDKARVAGAGARRSNGVITEFSRAVYSPCDLCEDDPSAAPLWQLKAIRVIHDSEEKQVSYRNAWLELYGIPVAYTPYLSHPDPTVKRRSGFLAPSFSNSSDLGFQLQAPYFWAIDEHQDATFTPMLSTDGGQGAIAEYRRYFKRGYIDGEGSFVADDPDKGLRGYVNLETMYHLDPTWRAGLDVETASDDTYTRRYGFNTESVLVSRGYVEGFRGQNYQALNTYAFKDLRQDSNPDDSPIVLPMYDFNYDGKRDRLGGYTSFDFNALNIARESGTDTRRLAFRPRWDRPFNGPFGELYNASVSLAADTYHASHVTRDDGTNYSGISGRAVPRASLSWRLPLIRPGENYSQTIEPLASVVVAPNGGNTDKIPNEDSQEIEFDETNLFQDNRYDGFDRVDSGTRINYGMNWGLTGYDGGDASVFLGQSYQPRVDSSFNQASGIDDNFSDIVGRVQISPRRYLNLIYRTQFSPDNFSPQRNEVSADIGAPALNLQTDYIFMDQQAGSEFSGREEINGTLSSQMNRNWSSYLRARHDIVADDIRSLGLGFVYEDECVKFTTAFTRSFYEDRDLKPSDAVTFTLVLKTLGEVHSGVSRSQ